MEMMSLNFWVQYSSNILLLLVNGDVGGADGVGVVEGVCGSGGVAVSGAGVIGGVGGVSCMGGVGSVGDDPSYLNSFWSPITQALESGLYLGSSSLLDSRQLWPWK